MYYDEITLATGVQLKAYCPRLCETNANGPARPAIVICGGGGYQYVSGREDEPIALRFLTMGFCCFTVSYRVAPNRFPTELQDAGAAVAWVRTNSSRLGVDPDRIAIGGFSAGGHLAAMLGVMWQREEIFSPLGLSCEQVKPNALMLSYPVITAGPHAHRGSFVNLTGSENLSDHAPFSLENLVTEATPPTFLWHTWEDGAVPVENTLLFASALRRAGRIAEVHIFPSGRHGLSLANELTGNTETAGIVPELQGWPEMAGRFLKSVM